jgi:hypothetical protein
MSSCLNALAAVTWEDMLKPFFGHISESRKTWVTRLLGKFLIMNDLIDLFIVFNATFSFYAECIIMLHGVFVANRDRMVDGFTTTYAISVYHR